MNDQFLKDLISHDEAGVPDQGIEARLSQAFMLRSASYPTKQNSFAGFFGWIFSIKGMFLKTSLAGILLALFMYNSQFKIDSSSPVLLDSTRVTQSLQVDSALFQMDSKNAGDSILL